MSSVEEEDLIFPRFRTEVGEDHSPGARLSNQASEKPHSAARTRAIHRGLPVPIHAPRIGACIEEEEEGSLCNRA